ncbi:MBL fold metallo-hydrolase [Halalkalibacter urbisdiaboli]|uniref:MBL fold metallo-hydrolase n=1 Tax=Halalkalibacter urbisdiaboli TaxID=1960589 RepID=UPI000B450928|nr:MBL fold metallo-hydrolase [Halalkalibacter urbisdiaboli]
MKVTVVGFWHGYPEANSATSGYLLEHDEYKLLLDCGSGVLSNVQSFCSLDDLNGIVLSHYHGDHKADITPFQYSRILNAQKSGYKTPIIYGHNDDKAEFSKLPFRDVVKAIPYNDYDRLLIGPFVFFFQRTNHPVPCYAMKVELAGKILVYTADSSFSEELASFAKGCDLLISECSAYAGETVSEFGHMNSEDAGRLAALAQAKSLILTHLPHYGEHQQLKVEASEQFSGEIYLAKQGFSIEL